MSFLFDLFKSFGFGVMLFFILPVISSAIPWEYAKRIISVYQSIAMSLLGRAVMLQRRHGGLKLKKSAYDPGLSAEKVRIGTKSLYFQDPHNFMSTFKGYPFGLAHEDRNVIVDARTAYLAGKLLELVRRNDLKRQGMLKAYFAIDPEGLELADLNDIKAVVQKSASPGLPARIRDYAEKSQSGFNSPNVMQQMQLFMALAVGAGLMWLLKEFQNSAGGGGGTIIDLTILVPVI